MSHATESFWIIKSPAVVYVFSISFISLQISFVTALAYYNKQLNLEVILLALISHQVEMVVLSPRKAMLLCLPLLFQELQRILIS